MIRTRVGTAVAGALAIVAGLGGGGPDAASAAVGPEVVAETVGRLYGTPEQRTAAQELEEYVVRAVIAECAWRKDLDHHDTDWDWPVVPMEQHDMDLEVLFWPPLADFGVAREHARNAEQAARPAPAPPGPGWIDEFNDCEVEAAPLDYLHKPAGQLTLMEKFYWEFAPVRDEHALRLSAAYGRCMAAAGTPAASLRDAHEQVERGYRVRGRAWGDLVAYEKKIAAADGKCRRAGAAMVSKVIAAATRAFAERHRDELAAVAEGWAAMPAARDEARRHLNVVLRKR
ncbi:hypothetical protein ACFY36_09440 [Actinoplanes sp. NPDC000266]